MNKIAFDLDGVLVPDYHHIPKLTMQDFYEYTLYAKPLFNPNGQFDIVTARKERFRAVTECWIRQLAVQPINIFMLTDDDENPADFKYRICIEQGYSTYIESDRLIVDAMRKLVNDNNKNLNVYHFAEFIENSLKIS